MNVRDTQDKIEQTIDDLAANGRISDRYAQFIKQATFHYSIKSEQDINISGNLDLEARLNKAEKEG